MALVISTEQKEVLGVLYLEGQEQQYGFNLHRSSALVIAEKQVVCLGWPPFKFKDFPQIAELTMNIANYFDWRLEL